MLQDRVGVRPVVDAVVVDGHGGRDGQVVGVAADAAQVGPVVDRTVGQARREIGEVLDALDAHQRALLGGERGDGHRHVLQALRPPFGRDDQLGDRACCIGACGARRRGRGLGLERR